MEVQKIFVLLFYGNTLSVEDWVENTNAVGIYEKRGRFGGTYAHKEIEKM